MLEIKDYNIGIDINNYFIIIAFCNPKSQNWKTLKAIITNNFKCFEKDKYFYLLCEEEPKQINILLTILPQIYNWKTINIFYKGNLINYRQLNWLECYKNHLLNKKAVCYKDIPAIFGACVTINFSFSDNSITQEEREEPLLRVPCEKYPNYYTPFGSQDIKQSIKNVNDYFNIYPDKHNLYLCPLFNKNFNFEKENFNQLNINNQKISNNYQKSHNIKDNLDIEYQNILKVLSKDFLPKEIKKTINKQKDILENSFEYELDHLKNRNYKKETIDKKSKELEEKYNIDINKIENLLEDKNIKKIVDLIIKKPDIIESNLQKLFETTFLIDHHISYNIAYNIYLKIKYLIDRYEQQAIGFQYFEWCCIDDGISCEKCKKRNHHIYSWKDGANGEYPIFCDCDCKNTYCRCNALSYDIDLEEYEPLWSTEKDTYIFKKKRIKIDQSIRHKKINKKKNEFIENIVSLILFLIFVAIIIFYL